MSNSKLVTVTQISPNKNSPRNHAIDRITIHCFVGQVTAKRGCEVFQPTSKQASCNYVVGYDGSIGLCVEEKDRSWCSSNSANDHRAVTIETASETVAPYKVTDKAYNALLDLVTDICKRNGKTKILWFGDKNKTLAYTPKVNEMVMTVHRWFAAKACPGDYLYNRHGEIAAEVNRRLEGEEEPMDIAKLISEMTNEQAYQLMQKAELHAKTLSEPAWSQQEGHWAKAVANGIVDGTSPERPAKRDEMIAILGRLGLL